ncbi:hypothetical protein FOZ62_001818, partial [Perkinsus olseni]
ALGSACVSIENLIFSVVLHSVQATDFWLHLPTHVSNDDIKKLTACYWFSVEFGSRIDCKGAVEAYGDGDIVFVWQLITLMPSSYEHPISTMVSVFVGAKSIESAEIQLKA